MSGSNARATDVPDRDERYISDADAQDLEEISDPATTTDETRSSLLEWVHSHPYLTTLLVLALPVILGIVTVLITRIAPGLLTNRWVQGGIALAVYSAGLSYVMRVDQRNQLEGVGELDLVGGNGLQTHKGHFGTTSDGDPYFQPVKGYTRFGRVGDGFTVEEFSPRLARKYEAAGGDPEEPARILLRPAFMSVNRTDYGTRVVQLTDGLVVHGFSTEVALQVQRPSVADESALEDATQTIDTLEKELRNLKAKNTRLREQKRDAEEEAKRRRQDIKAEVLEDFREVAEAERARRYGAGLSENGRHPEPIDDGQSTEDLQQMYLDDE